SDFVGADRALKVLGLMRVSDIVNRKPKNIIQGADRSQEALAFLSTKEIRYGIVLEQNKPIGFVTQKTLKYEEGPVRDVVEPYPLFLREKTPLRDVLSFMLMHDVATFCVVDGDKNFAGTVTYNDIQKAVKASYADEAENVETEVEVIS
ncbi:MAG: CBS domain-containing protein, partial [Actinobacteria bacterium]|nr:CBS domain-containing protein [Actinomycetota bacterium]